MRYVTFVFVTLLLHAGMSMAQNGPPASIGLAEGNPSAVGANVRICNGGFQMRRQYGVLSIGGKADVADRFLLNLNAVTRCICVQACKLESSMSGAVL